jgi:hypothetical protein
MSPSWQLHLAHIDVSLHGRRLQPLPLENVAGTHQLRFKDRIELGTPMAAETADIEVGVRLTYPDRTVVQVAMRPSRERREAGALIDLLPSWSAQPRSEVEGRLQIAGITVDQTPIFLSRVATQPHRPAQRFLPTSQGK